MTFIDTVNAEFYEKLFSSENWVHKYPNVNSVRCEQWYFRRRSWPGRLLDYGFGSGQEMIYFAEAGYEVYGVEISPRAIDRFHRLVADRHPQLADRLQTRRLDPSDSRLDFADDFFDFIHSNQVISHVANETAVRSLIQEWYRILSPAGRLMFSIPGLHNSVIAKGREVEPNVYEWEYESPNYKKEKMRNYCLKDEAAIREMARPFEVDEVGWFTNHYCGVDGFFWQVLARKSDPAKDAAGGPTG